MDPMIVQSSNSGVKMDGGTDVRKPWLARKTMTPSSRRQMKMLKKIKEGAEIAPNTASSQDKDLSVKNSDVNQFLNTGALQDILYSWYETGSSSLLCKPVEVHLNAKPGVYISDSSGARSPSSPPAGDTPTSSTGTNTGGMALEQESTDFRFHEKNATAFMPDNPQTKRTSENSDDTICKRKRKSEEAREDCRRSSYQRQPGLEKSKGLIQEQLAALMSSVDHQIQHLHRQIDHTQCLQKKQEEMAIQVVKKISSLDRRIIKLKKKELAFRVNLPGVNSQCSILNCPTTLPGDKSSGLRPSEKEPSGPKETPPETTKERSDDVIFLNKVIKNPGVAAVNPPAVQQEGPAANTDAATPSTSKHLIIDLTDEKSIPNTGYGAERPADMSNSATEGQNPNPPRPELQPSNQVDEDFSHLPPLPKSRSHQEPVAKFRGTLPPLKLDLSVVRVENPKGIALQWNVQRPDPRCAPLESFHLFLFLKGSQLSSWQETNQILAKKLPMACTLTGFPESSWCYLAMRAKDIYGRYGPFSDIQSILTL